MSETINVKPPCVITSRLRCGVKIGQSEISIAFDGWSDDGRTVYRYWLDLYLDGKRIECEGNDLQSGVGGGTLQHGLESLLSFLQACGESYGYRLQLNLNHTGDNRLDEQLDDIDDNANLFPKDVAEWCYMNSDELTMLAIELSETPDAIE